LRGSRIAPIRLCVPACTQAGSAEPMARTSLLVS